MAVYFIQAGEDGPIKIGLSEDPPFRLMQLQISHWQVLRLLAVMEGDAATEAALHVQFAEAHVRGEWHYPVPALKTLVADLLRVPTVAPDVEAPPAPSASFREFLVAKRGNMSMVAKALGLHHSTVLGWDVVPANRCRAVHEITGIPLHDLRPDVYAAAQVAA